MSVRRAGPLLLLGLSLAACVDEGPGSVTDAGWDGTIAHDDGGDADVADASDEGGTSDASEEGGLDGGSDAGPAWRDDFVDVELVLASSEGLSFDWGEVTLEIVGVEDGGRRFEPGPTPTYVFQVPELGDYLVVIGGSQVTTSLYAVRVSESGSSPASVVVRPAAAIDDLHDRIDGTGVVFFSFSASGGGQSASLAEGTPFVFDATESMQPGNTLLETGPSAVLYFDVPVGAIAPEVDSSGVDETCAIEITPDAGWMTLPDAITWIDVACVRS